MNYTFFNSFGLHGFGKSIFPREVCVTETKNHGNQTFPREELFGWERETQISSGTAWMAKRYSHGNRKGKKLFPEHPAGISWVLPWVVPGIKHYKRILKNHGVKKLRLRSPRKIRNSVQDKQFEQTNKVGNCRKRNSCRYYMDTRTRQKKRSRSMEKTRKET